MARRHGRHALVFRCVFFGAWAAALLLSAAQAAGPRDHSNNPIAKPKLPELPDLYSEPTQQDDEEDDNSRDPDAAGAPGRETSDLGELAAGESRASSAMRAELQRQLALFPAISGEPDQALIQLLAAQSRGWLTLAGNRAALDAARLYRQLDLPAEAERLYSTLPAWLIPRDEQQAFLLQRVQSRYNRGEYHTAAQMLEELGTPANPEIANQAEDLRIRIYMAQGRYSNINRLFEQQLGQPRNNLYTRYNLGVSLVAGGQTGAGIGQLDELGRIPAIDPEPKALRDKANLSLGWAFLQADQGATARPFLRRVRIDGPFSGSALLALGWALLAPDGEPQEKTIARLQNCLNDPALALQETRSILRRPAREPCGKPKVFRHKRPLEYEPVSGNANERLQAALAPWNTLIKRPAHDPAVQEALLARGYVLEQLQQREAAADAYRMAIERLEEERQRMQTRLQSIQKTPLAAVMQPAATDSPYLSELVNSPELEEARQALQALDKYTRRLQSAQARMQRLPPQAAHNPAMQDVQHRIRQLQARQASLQDSYREVVSRLVTYQFEQRDEMLGTYLRRARLSLVNLHGQGR